jgi:biotin transport system substrate-specific component
MRVLSKNIPLYLTIAILLSFAGAMLAASLIRIPVPFSPVPITMQTLVLFAGIALLKKRAAVSQITFLLFGSATGLLLLAGPTGGYLTGFLIASLICPVLMPKKTSFLKLFLVFGLANAIVYINGVLWLATFLNSSITSALTAGVLPFVVTDIIKIALASAIFSRIPSEL